MAGKKTDERGSSVSKGDQTDPAIKCVPQHVLKPSQVCLVSKRRSSPTLKNKK